MRRELPLPKELGDQIPPEAQAAIWVLVEGYERRLRAWETEVTTRKGESRELRGQLNQNSQNSARPSSSDGPQVKRPPPCAPAGRKRGAQPGPPVQRRALVPLEQVTAVVECKPPHWRHCGGAVHGSDPEPRRHQVIEVPPPTPHVTEYQLPRVAWARCELTPWGTLPPGVPAHSYGPRLARLVALGSGAYRMSKRMVASFCTEVLGVPLAGGEICPVQQTVAAALEPPVQEARGFVQGENANVDETTWREQRRRVWLWGVVTQGVRVFGLRSSRGARVLRELLGVGERAVLTSERAKAYNGQPLRWRQLWLGSPAARFPSHDRPR